MSIGINLFFIVILSRLVSELLDLFEVTLASLICDLQVASGLVVSMLRMALTTFGIIKLRFESIGASDALTKDDDLVS